MITVFANGTPHNVAYRHGLTLRDALNDAGVQVDGPYSFGVDGQNTTNLGQALNDGATVSAIQSKMSGAGINPNTGLPQSFPFTVGVYVDCVEEYDENRNEPRRTKRGRAVLTEPQWLVEPDTVFAHNLGDAFAQARMSLIGLAKGAKEGEVVPGLDPDSARDVVVFAKNLLTGEVMVQNP